MNKTLKKINKRVETLDDLFAELTWLDKSKINEEFLLDLAETMSSLQETIDDMTVVFFPSPYETYLKKIKSLNK